ncbi:MAG TPA: hypothetical protein DCM08_05360 [Microscillaceae bacterium]|jgi:hypothetical protein|nr:hypothetical protein [Microscillaceae bacterium]
MPQLIVDNEFATVTFHEAEQYILFRYKAFGSSFIFRSTWTAAADFAIQHKIGKWLSDSREMAVIPPSDQQWFTDVWRKRIREENIGVDNLVAIVLGDKIFAVISAQMMLTGAENTTAELKRVNQQIGSLKIKYFSAMEEANEWLALSGQV